MTYDVGDVARLEVAFTDIDKVPKDPTIVTLLIQAPDNTQITVTYPDIVHDGAADSGTYHYDLPIAQSGTTGDNQYLYRWTATGAVTAVKEGTVTVTPTILVPQPVADIAEFTTSDLAALDAAIKSGVLKVQFADRLVTYWSLADLIRARNFIATQVAGTTGTPMRRQLRIFTNKGFGG